jgi:hypothetical protein
LNALNYFIFFCYNWNWLYEIKIFRFLNVNWLWWLWLYDRFEFIWELASKLLVWILTLWHFESQTFCFKLLFSHHYIKVLSLKF